MEFLKGNDLSHYCNGSHLLPVPLVICTVARVAEASDYAHHQMAVHRDIKPANIRYDHKSDAVKVTDFGISCVTDSNETKTGLVFGTLSEEAPSVRRVRPALPEALADIVAVMLCKRPELRYQCGASAAPDLRGVMSASVACAPVLIVPAAIAGSSSSADFMATHLNTVDHDRTDPQQKIALTLLFPLVLPI